MSGGFFGLTNSANIRAQLGASDTEFSDSFIEDLELDNELQLDLLSWFPAYQDLVDSSETTTIILQQQLGFYTF